MHLGKRLVLGRCASAPTGRVYAQKDLLQTNYRHQSIGFLCAIVGLEYYAFQVAKHPLSPSLPSCLERVRLMS